MAKPNTIASTPSAETTPSTPTEAPAPKKRNRKPPSVFSRAETLQRELTDLDDRLLKAQLTCAELESKRATLTAQAEPDVIAALKAVGVEITLKSQSEVN